MPTNHKLPVVPDTPPWGLPPGPKGKESRPTALRSAMKQQRLLRWVTLSSRAA
jgi:hypothetical protein